MSAPKVYPCAHCGHEMKMPVNAVTRKPHPPEPGNFMLCGWCLQQNIFDAEMKAQRPTAEELATISPQTLAAVELAKIMMRAARDAKIARN